jgi:hypothetical protein
MRIGSGVTLLICVTALFVGYIISAFFPASQYGVFAPSLVALATAYFTKRVVQKNPNFGGGPKPDETVTTTRTTSGVPPETKCADINKIGDIHGQD